MILRRHFGLLAAAALLLSGSVSAQVKFPGDGNVNLDVPYVPTPQPVVNRMLELAKAGPNDIHYDLGSGDGRIVVTAVRDFKVKKGVGVDIDPVRIREANANAKAAGVTDRVTFMQTDLFKFDFTEASVLTLYLLPDVNLALRPIILDKLKPGTRVVSHSFTMGDWRPDVQDVVEGEALYHWVVPAKAAGHWEWSIDNVAYQADLSQTFQVVTGTLKGPTGLSNLRNPKLTGENLTFELSIPRNGVPTSVVFEGKVVGDKLTGTMTFGGGPKSPVNATRK